jgi:hypothetical protein
MGWLRDITEAIEKLNAPKEDRQVRGNWGKTISIMCVDGVPGLAEALGE